MTERPILFNSPMVRAILDGRKIQTRRPMKPQPVLIPLGLPMPGVVYTAGWYDDRDVPDYVLKHCPLGVPGDHLWVRETRHSCPHCHDIVVYRADGWMTTVDGEIDTEDMRPLPRKCAAHGWKPSIHMPRRFSRITLEIVAVRVERVQEITPHDVVSEGIIIPDQGSQKDHAMAHIGAFRDLWDSIYAKHGAGWDVNPWVWDLNPWVWVISFRRIEELPR